MAKNGEAVRRAEKGPLIGVRTKGVIRERWDGSLAELHKAGVGNATGGVLMGSNLVEMWAVWFATRPTGERVKLAREYRAAYGRQLDRIEAGMSLEVEGNPAVAAPGEGSIRAVSVRTLPEPHGEPDGPDEAIAHEHRRPKRRR